MIPLDKCGLSLDVQDKTLRTIRNYPQVTRIVLYGSRAKGKFKTGSYIDLTIEAPTAELFLLSKIENEALLDHIKRVGIELGP
jgi:uncharacterized protein